MTYDHVIHPPLKRRASEQSGRQASARPRLRFGPLSAGFGQQTGENEGDPAAEYPLRLRRHGFCHSLSGSRPHRQNLCRPRHLEDADRFCRPRATLGTVLEAMHETTVFSQLGLGWTIKVLAWRRSDDRAAMPDR